MAWADLSFLQQEYLRFSAGLFNVSRWTPTSDINDLKGVGVLDADGVINAAGVRLLAENGERPRWSPIGGWSH